MVSGCDQSMSTAEKLDVCKNVPVTGSKLIHSLSDDTVENGMCATFKTSLELRPNGLDPEESCLKAAMYLSMEFDRRFPDRNSEDTIRECVIHGL